MLFAQEDKRRRGGINCLGLNTAMDFPLFPIQHFNLIDIVMERNTVLVKSRSAVLLRFLQFQVFRTEDHYSMDIV